MMEKKKTVFDYIRAVFTTFGIMVIIFVAFCSVIGESARGYSTFFALGKDGIALSTLCELLLFSILINLVNIVFLTDNLIMNMSIAVRYALFILSAWIIGIIMIILFHWFPIGDVSAWMGFVVSFAVSMSIAVLLTRLKERVENSKMQEALEKYNNRKNS